MTAPTISSCSRISSLESAARQPGNRLELVERAAGVAESPTRELGHRRAARGHQRREDERDLVADAARGVLVDASVARVPSGRGVSPDAIMRSVQVRSSRVADASKEDRHQQRRHLLFGDFAALVGVQDPGDRSSLSSRAVTLGGDDVDRGEELTGLLRASRGLRGRTRRAAARAGAWRRVVARVDEQPVAAVLEEQLATASARARWVRRRPRRSTTATRRPPPCRMRSLTSEHSAQSVRP